jgi:hypothetical protein
MNKTLFLFIAGVLMSLATFAQQLPLNACGIVCTYDASGNRLKRVYFCNNGTDPYPTRVETTAKTTEEVQQADALYPNPTTGKFYVTFRIALNKATVYIMDVTGKAISRFTASGNTINFDLSSSPGGIYFIRIDDGENTIVKKVVKQ